jgi:NTE family protein
MNNEIKNLAFKGGGVKGIAYVGSLQALEDKGITNQVIGFSGTSAGSIVAALAACRIKAADLKSFLANTNYEKFKDKGGFYNFIKDLTEDFGIYQGDYFLNEWFKPFLKQQGIDSEITFKGVKHKFGTNLKVYATDLNVQSIKEFSVEATPNIQIAYAVRASMSIPLFFKAWKFPGNDPNNHIYVDGGVMYNYPIDAFDSGNSPLDQTLGFFLLDLTGKPAVSNNLDYGFSHLETYIKSLFEAILNAQNYDVQHNNFEIKRTVQVNDLGISAIDFGITSVQANALYQMGYDATNNFLKGIS